MSNVARGVVSKLWEKQFSGKTLHSFSLEGQKEYFGTGERKVVEVGKAYEFQTKVSPTGRINVDIGTLRPWDAPAGALQAEPVKSFRAPFKADPDKEAYWKNKEARDVTNDKHRELGATRNTAISLVSLMLSNGAIKLPAKESAKEEVIFQLFEHYTEELLKGKDTKAERLDTPENVPMAAPAVPETEDNSWK